MRDDLMRSIREQGMTGDDSPADEPAPVASLELFFNGNEDPGSIGCNLDEHPGTVRFFEVLRSIRDRADVQDVLVEIYDIPGENEWPFSERVYILTAAPIETVEHWTADLQPSELGEGWQFGKPPAAPEARPGSRVISVWWD